MRQEAKAESSLAALEKMMKNIARVRRDGQAIEIEAEQIVPGDIVLMEAGNRVPADGRLFVTATMEIEEAALTGESVASSKDTQTIAKADAPLGDRHCMAYMNTSVTRGRGEMIVTTTGMGTEMGTIADLLNKTEADKTPLQKQLDKLTITIAGLAGVAFLPDGHPGPPRRRSVQRDLHGRHRAGDFGHPDRHARRGHDALLDGHPHPGRAERHREAAAIGRNARLGLRHLLGQDGHADAEQDDRPRVHASLARTATRSPVRATAPRARLELTRGLAAGQPWQKGSAPYTTDGQILSAGGPKIDLDPVLLPMALCADARLDGERRPLIGDPTEGALIVLAEKGGISVEGAREMYPRVAEVPFDSDYKFMATFHNMTDEKGKPVVRAFVKGAPDVLIARAARYWLPDGESAHP